MSAKAVRVETRSPLIDAGRIRFLQRVVKRLCEVSHGSEEKTRSHDFLLPIAAGANSPIGQNLERFAKQIVGLRLRQPYQQQLSMGGVPIILKEVSPNRMSGAG